MPLRDGGPYHRLMHGTDLARFDHRSWSGKPCLVWIEMMWIWLDGKPPPEHLQTTNPHKRVICLTIFLVSSSTSSILSFSLLSLLELKPFWLKEYFPIVATFIAGYAVIVLEEQTEINKAATALVSRQSLATFSFSCGSFGVPSLRLTAGGSQKASVNGTKSSISGSVRELPS